MNVYSSQAVETAQVVANMRDVIATRPDEGGEVPSWCVGRGWGEFLCALDDQQVEHAERFGFAATLRELANVPVSLRELGETVARLIALPLPPRAEVFTARGRRESPRKHEQIAAFGVLASRVSHHTTRVVDLGSGHGHLTRSLAAQLCVPSVGIERDPARVAVASALTTTPTTRFATDDVRALREPLGRDDLIVGLHACGELGDLLICAAREASASVVLIGCCMQKRLGSRHALTSWQGVEKQHLTLEHSILGIANAWEGENGIEESLATRTTSRVQRSALRSVLRACGIPLEQGGEMRGLNRRHASRDFYALVRSACAVREVQVPSEQTVEKTLAHAWKCYAKVRRYTLPRTMLGRLVEVWVAYDRAAFLSQHGYETEVLTAFEMSVSPRNIAVLGRLCRT
jgi:hypothetical protein